MVEVVFVRVNPSELPEDIECGICLERHQTLIETQTLIEKIFCVLQKCFGSKTKTENPIWVSHNKTHAYHFICLNNWFQKRNAGGLPVTCPACRTPFDFPTSAFSSYLKSILVAMRILSLGLVFSVVLATSWSILTKTKMKSIVPWKLAILGEISTAMIYSLQTHFSLKIKRIYFQSLPLNPFSGYLFILLRFQASLLNLVIASLGTVGSIPALHEYPKNVSAIFVLAISILGIWASWNNLMQFAANEELR